MTERTDDESPEDIFSAVIDQFGGKRVEEEDLIDYKFLRLSAAQKANTLLADHLFSPALYLAELIETREISCAGKRVIELGCGCGLPSLLLATYEGGPRLVVLTDYPDPDMLANLQSNVSRNRGAISAGCKVISMGYEWGTDVSELLSLATKEVDVVRSTSIGQEPTTALSASTRNDSQSKFDVVILSDLLHFNDSHAVLLQSVVQLLAKTADAVIYVAAGKYTKEDVCARFVKDALGVGLAFTEKTAEREGVPWQGSPGVGGLSSDELQARKEICRYWVGGWAD